MGRNSGGMTGSTSSTIHVGLAFDLRKSSTTFRRLIAFCLRWPLEERDSSRRRYISEVSSIRESRSRTASAPMPARKARPNRSWKSRYWVSVRICLACRASRSVRVASISCCSASSWPWIPSRLGADAGLDVLGGLLALCRQRVDRLLQLFLEPGDLRVDFGLQLLGLGLMLLAKLARLGVDVSTQADRPLVFVHVEDGEHVLANFLVDVGDDVVREVEDLLEVARRHVEQQTHAARDALEVPDVADRRRELDVAHALAAHLGPRDLDAALVADDALVAVALVLSAVAFPVPGGTENALAEKSVALRAERAVVDRLRLRDLAMRPGHDRVGRRQRQLQRVKVF